MNRNRRSFLKTTAGAALAAPAVVRAANLNGNGQHACIGVGGMGANDLKHFVSHGKTTVVAICDVDGARLEAAAQVVPEARKYTDWRELLEKEGGRIDSVNVTVPDHMHFPIAMKAVQAGKHVYCQKPMCHDVAEVRALTEAVRKAGVKSQLGTQGASGFGDRAGIYHLRQGVIGKIKHVYLCSNRPGVIGRYRLVGPRPEESQAPPENLAWNLWLGNAPVRPYAPEIYHPAKWRTWQDFGTGWSGDIGCHVFDATWKALGLTAPTTVRATVQESWRNSPARRADTWPQSDHITWTFPGTPMTAGDEITVEWFDGETYPPEAIRKLYPGESYPFESAMLVGTEGAIVIPNGKMPTLMPKEKFASVEAPDLEPRNHYHHFLDAIHGTAENESFFDVSGPMTEAILLGTVAIRTPGETLEWDAEKLAITNHPGAHKLLRRDYRDGWGVAGF
ncbi:MAG: Gfo/Idh/MocA family oxidoreductase [Akkermansiaceae bacterium]|nr:Gfo/Idh/MocA family oxidoreductase [Akkermansiaceae bacterium]